MKRIAKDAGYENGFKINGQCLPFYSFEGAPCKDWSLGINTVVEEATKNHFIDVYNRKVAVQAIRKYTDKDRKYLCLDAGCSAGYLLEELQSGFQNLELYGADYDEKSLVVCHRNNPSVPLFRFDASKPVFPEESFDIVTCLNVLEHIDNDRAALTQLSRILKKNGLLVVTVPAFQSLYDLYDEVHCHRRRYGLKELASRLEEAGFEVLEKNYFGAVIFPFFAAVKMFNKVLHGKDSLEAKVARVKKSIKTTEGSRLMDLLCNMEYRVGRKMPFPFGVRLYAAAVKKQSVEKQPQRP